jgi:uncharacterized tellurite resistance protein B-like protein
MFFSDKNNNSQNELAKIAALLIHVAKIDQDFSRKEEEIIEKTMLEIGATNKNVKEIMNVAKEMENNSNQILDFTKKVKAMNEEDKVKIIEALWKIIYSNNEADIYETSLMRRLGGLLYIDNKVMGDIKAKVQKQKTQ